MHCVVNKNALLNLINNVSRAVATRTTKQILSGILINLSSNTLIATAYDLELGIQDELSVQTEDPTFLQISEPGSIVLPARYFLDVIRKLPDEKVQIQTNSNYITKIVSGHSEFHLHGIDASEFPKLPSFLSSNAFKVSSKKLRSLIESTVFATSSSEVRPILTGLHVELNRDFLSFTATDGLRLATKKYPFEEVKNHTISAVLPGKSLNELAKILPDSDEEVVLQLSEGHSLFIFGSMHVYTRLLSGAYPDTSRLIPSQWKTELLINRSELLSAVDRAVLILRDKENNKVKMEIQNNEMSMSSNSPEIGNVQEQLWINEKSGEDVQITFNGRYVLDALRNLESETVTIRLNGSNQPFVILENQENGSLQLISPVLTR
ncbi:DNA polymerase III subunit beta [Alicyclobacillus tolerans]|uniref:Beta sliding clamp n=2 Tax=Alicyclobacillus tolerans TaxID=90970 RepID=A0A1M6T550_9BACL|nr:DNA polymerase III subunit beta [Alicyclobacillus montanus]SHK52009.1 DNA polymerase III, beta subunit [Alicyclobacillus montanus]